MEKQKLKDYLRDVFELEKIKYETQQMIQRLEKQKYKAESYDLKPLVDINKGKSEGSGFGGFFIGGAIVGFLLSCSWSFRWNTFLVMIICGVISGCIGASIGAFLECKRQDDIIIENAYITRKNAEIRAQNNELQMEAQNKTGLTRKSCEEMRRVLIDVEETLKDMYSKDIIYPKYRNIVAVASMYEYLDSGRCSTLDGADGAYNTYELEIRLDRIITQLDVIISKLDQIMANQYYLYVAIKELQPKMDKITTAIVANTEKLNEVAVNTAITAYTTQVIEKNQYYGRKWNDGLTYSDRINMPKA